MLAVLLAVAWTGPAHATIQIGTVFVPEGGYCGSGPGFPHTYVQSQSPSSSSYEAPVAGVITGWSHRAGIAAPNGETISLKLKVSRGQVNPDTFGYNGSIVGEDGPRSANPGVLNTYGDIHIPVQAGDEIGLTVLTHAQCVAFGSSGLSGFLAHRFAGPDPAPGSSPPWELSGGEKVDVAATMEADADADGFGDESQDQCPNDATTQGPCPAQSSETVITSGPPAVVRETETTATFAFATTTSNPPPGHFECRIDDIGFAECASPKTFSSIAVGDHTFFVRYKPDGQAAGPVAERSWKVARCPDVRVGLVAVQGCFTERQVDGRGSGVFETAGEAWIGGFHIVPRPEGKLVIQNRSEAPLVAEGAGVDWVLGSVVVPAPLGEINPFAAEFAVVSLNTAGTIERFLALPLLNAFSGQVKVTWDAGGAGSKLEASVSMEELTKNLGKPFFEVGGSGLSVGTFAAKLSMVFANGKPAQLADGELEVPEFAIEFKDTNPAVKGGFGGGKLKAARVGATVEWSGEMTVLFPWEGKKGKTQGVIKARVAFIDAQIAGLGMSLSGFEQPLGGSGWLWTGVEGDVLFRPGFSFNVGVQVERRLGTVTLLKATGNLKALKLAEADCTAGTNPVEFVGTFNAPELEDQKIGELKGQLLMCGYVGGTRGFAFEVGLSGTLTVDFPPATKVLTATGSAKGWFSGFDFNFDGSYSLTLPLIGRINATGVFSSAGYAFCGQYGFLSAGFATDNWLEAPTDLIVCDFTPFRVATKPASASAAAAGETVRIPAGQSAFGFAVRGDNGAPGVRVSGPAGERFTSHADRATKTSKAIIVPIDDLKTTYVYLRKPRAGVWRIAAQGGGAGIKRVDSARQLPEPKIRARVTRKGSKVQVAWRSNKVPGQRIELLDRTRSGTATTIQKRTTKTRGRLTFTPADPLVKRRRIEAIILQNGSPRPPLIVARYKLTVPKRPSRARNPTAKRTSTAMAIAWLKAPRASGYVITIKAGTTVLTRTTTKTPRLTYTTPPPGKLTIQITPRDRLGRNGPTTTLTTP